MAVLLFQLVLGLVGMLTPRREIFPFASWFLFSLVPADVQTYDLLLRPPAPPGARTGAGVRYNEAGDLVRTPHSIVAYQLIQQLGNAETRGNTAAARRLREQIEESFAVSPLTYDLVRVTYSPVERWESGQVRTSVAVRSYVSGAAREKS